MPTRRRSTEDWRAALQELGLEHGETSKLRLKPHWGVENKFTKYGYFIPFVVVYPCEIERLCPAHWCHLQDCVPLVEGRETGCLSIGDQNGYRWYPLPQEGHRCCFVRTCLFGRSEERSGTT